MLRRRTRVAAEACAGTASASRAGAKKSVVTPFLGRDPLLGLAARMSVAEGPRVKNSSIFRQFSKKA